MLSKNIFVLPLCFASLMGCAGDPVRPAQSATPVVESEAVSEQVMSAAAQGPSQEVPVEVSLQQVLSCSNAPCVVPRKVIEQLCASRSADAALALFAAHSPVDRRYVRMREVDAINTLGGPSSDEKLVFDEEVIVLNGTPARKDVPVVSGANGHHVMRLDGTCATVMADELTTVRPPAPRFPRVTWGHLDSATQEALLANSAVKSARRTYRSTCFAVAVTNTKSECEKARDQLGNAVVKALRASVTLPDIKLRTM